MKLSEWGDKMKDVLFKKTENLLYNYTNIDAELEIIEFKLKDISVGAISYEERTAATNEIHSSVEDKTLKVLELQEKRKELLFKKELIEKALNLLDKTERELVEFRYFSLRKPSWLYVSMQLNLSEMSCLRIRNRVINKIGMYIN